MELRHLSPQLSLLQEEFVLVQAWKKTSNYIRGHNWYADTLELDRATVDLPRFLGDLRQRMANPAQWINEDLRIVPAPKSHEWRIASARDRWEPLGGRGAIELRPLARVALAEQVMATAVMLCLADRVETLQGDPRAPVPEELERKRMTSYGSRLYCDSAPTGQHHRWGSVKLYRGYFDDYRRFIRRPDQIAEARTAAGGKVVVVHSDLRQFYDRVRPKVLGQKLRGLTRDEDDPRFFDFAERLLDWRWNRRDAGEVLSYERQSGIQDFSRVALPQGLVSAGFFSNVVLLDFDRELRAAIGTQLQPGIELTDVCRYVDDLRLVLELRREATLDELEGIVFHWLGDRLKKTAAGLELSRRKTTAVSYGADAKSYVRQSRKMERIQKAISGGFDAVAGQEILEAVQGLIRSQQRFSEQQEVEGRWRLSPVPDVADATVARFAAGRFRSTYRSLRPLLPVETPQPETIQSDGEGASIGRAARTQTDLDDEARAFALGLIENWIHDPSNVRLLRIGLDIWPAKDVLEDLLALLRPFTRKGGGAGAARRVAWYCLAEIFRAGATETGFVEHGEALPAAIDLLAYRESLRQEAQRILGERRRRLPWYLYQQILLFLAAHGGDGPLVTRGGKDLETGAYWKFVRFLRGGSPGLERLEFARCAVLARRAFLSRERAVALVGRPAWRTLDAIAHLDPEFATEIVSLNRDLETDLPMALRRELCYPLPTDDRETSLVQLVMEDGPDGPLRSEPELLRFALRFLEAVSDMVGDRVVTPSDVWFRFGDRELRWQGDYALRVAGQQRVDSRSRFRVPYWCPPDESWRFQLGYLLRFILTNKVDFTSLVRPPSWREGQPIYRVPESHWYQRQHGLFCGYAAYGDDWLPISDWLEGLIAALLHWPGCRPSEMVNWIRFGQRALMETIRTRIAQLGNERGALTNILMLRVAAPHPTKVLQTRPLRACVLQTVLPGFADFSIADLKLNGPVFRQRHRNHLATALAAVERMLELRETHQPRGGRLDWLILPELSVHPDDVKAYLVPFARQHKTLILAGLTYEEIRIGAPLVNAALWVIPVWSHDYGLQVLTRRQGKQHLAPEENAMVNAGVLRVRGYRPCQWLVGYEWSTTTGEPPLWLTASVCYDATDIRLAGDLREKSDILAIPALNKDVGTFDQMAQALHYHMYQMVVIANNGEFGGSNAYAPYKEHYHRQVFHVHGQPQASVTFFEIDQVADFIGRGSAAVSPGPLAGPIGRTWKSKPAGHGSSSAAIFQQINAPFT